MISARLCTCRCHRTAYNNTTDKTSNYFYSSHPDIFMCRHSRVFVMIMSHATATWLPGLQQAHCIQNTFLLTDLISLQFIPSVIIITSPRCLKSDPPVKLRRPSHGGWKDWIGFDCGESLELEILWHSITGFPALNCLLVVKGKFNFAADPLAKTWIFIELFDQNNLTKNSILIVSNLWCIFAFSQVIWASDVPASSTNTATATATTTTTTTCNYSKLSSNNTDIMRWVSVSMFIFSVSLWVCKLNFWVFVLRKNNLKLKH